MDLATALVWTLRIVLPIILFCIYFKLQAPKDELNLGPITNVIKRETFLVQRKATSGKPAPESMSNIALKDQIEAPQLFIGRGGKGGGRRVKDETREAPAGKERRGKGEKEARKSFEEVEGEAEEPTPTADQENLELHDSEDKMHLESLLNYVAFTNKEQQRIFLPETGAPPPPPPPPKARPGPETEGGAVSSSVSGATAEKANREAQMVLRGALGLKRSDVAKHLFDQLQEAQVETSESTFELMINVFLKAKDLKGASDLLINMETAGFLPGSDLLDKVMELYSRQKNAREREKLAKAEALSTAPVRSTGVSNEVVVLVPGEDDRTKLNSTAAVFVPSFIPQPPPGPEVEPMVDLGPSETQQDLANRTRLTAESKPFEPRFNVTFDPFAYTWTVDGGEEAGSSPEFQRNQAQDFYKSFEKGQDFFKGNNGKGWGKEGKGWENDSRGWEKGEGSHPPWENEGKGWEKGKSWEKGKGWENDTRQHDSKGWEKGKGKAQAHTNGKNWDNTGKYWPSDANWYSDTKWSSDSTWDFDDKATQKKVWVEKQHKESEGEQGKGDSKWKEGKKPIVKTWKPKAEGTNSAEEK